MTYRTLYECESCGCGYWQAYAGAGCHHCGAADWLSHRLVDRRIPCDTECYPDYWLCNVGDRSFQLFAGHPLDTQGLRQALTTATMITFNGDRYDHPMISLALTGVSAAELWAANNQIIVPGRDQGLMPWMFAKHYNINLLQWDSIDLMNVAPGMGGLKAYGGKMHARKLQDLPIDVGTSIGLFDRPVVRDYCGNDCETTMLLADRMSAQIKLREEMSVEYGVDLRSKSDAQIAEAAMKAALPFEVQVPVVPVGSQFQYRPPAWMSFKTQQMQDVFRTMCSTQFAINDKGGVSPSYHNCYVDWGKDQVRINPHGYFDKRPADWQHKLVTIGGMSYAMGIGGLHSTENRRALVAGPGRRLLDRDVAGYYPSLIIETGIYPKQIGEVFKDIYRGWYDRRMEAKRAGNKKVANSLKTVGNGTFGKLGSKYSIFYAPAELIQVTMTGQLALLMLIERFELEGISIVSGNTDGIVMSIADNQYNLYLSIISWWEQLTGFETEETEYRAVYSRDVNSYVAITTDGKLKTKGAYAPPEPGASGWPNPTTQICVDAVCAYLLSGTPIETTILSCTDVRQFVAIRDVKGGGVWSSKQVSIDDWLLLVDTGTAQNVWVAAGDPTLTVKRKSRPKPRMVWVDDERLGRIVRWYYATGATGPIRYRTTGSTVPKTEGCRPMMELSDRLPVDINYLWYFAEARSLLNDVGVTV
jgi:hypothetical protein